MPLRARSSGRVGTPAPREIAMAKGQKRKTKEVRKPKAPKPKPPEQVKR
jgi:hypothetical protein